MAGTESDRNSSTGQEAVTMLQRFLLALCVWREARGETSRGKRLVAAVVKNRVSDKRWPNTYEAVITQPLQFSSFNRNDPNTFLFPPEEDPSWPDCVAAADETIKGEVATTANHYHVAGLDPVWRDETKVVAVEGHHVFYRL